MSKVSFAAKCPSCKSFKVWKDGLRKIASGDVQRWLCRDCGFRFSKNKNRPSSIGFTCQIGAMPKAHGLVRNLTSVEPRIREGSAGATKLDAKSEILEYLWYLKKKGLRQSTIEHYGQKLRQLCKLGVNLSEPEQVKKCLATNEKWNERTKAIFVGVYDGFANFMGISWEPPKYRSIRKLPFIPTEQEIDQFISGCGKKLATFLQLLKETGVRCGEASQLEWIDVDFKRRVVRITPEKGSNPRILPISTRLVEMLNNMPKSSNKVFPAMLGSIKATCRTHAKA